MKSGFDEKILYKDIKRLIIPVSEALLWLSCSSLIFSQRRSSPFDAWKSIDRLAGNDNSDWVPFLYLDPHGTSRRRFVQGEDQKEHRVKVVQSNRSDSVSKTHHLRTRGK